MRTALLQSVSIASLVLLLPAAPRAQGCGPSQSGAVFYDSFANLANWNYGFSYAPTGFTDNTMGSWHVNPNAPGMPADANVFSTGPGGLSIALKNTPADVNPALVGSKPFLSGIVTSKFSRQYGYFEIRMRTPAVSSGGSSAFWLLDTSGGWPPEIDAPELEFNNHTGLNWGLHSGPSNDTPLLWTYDWNDTSAAMHTYGVDWQPNTVSFYADGQLMYQKPTPPDMNQPMYMLIDTLAATDGSWVGSPPSTINASLTVQYVAVYPSRDAAVAAQGSGGSAPCPAVASAASPQGASAMPAPTSPAVDAANSVAPSTDPNAGLPVPTNAYTKYATALKIAAPTGTAPEPTPPAPADTASAASTVSGGTTQTEASGSASGYTVTGTGNVLIAVNGPKQIDITGPGNLVTTGPYNDRIVVTSVGNVIDAGGGRNTIVLAGMEAPGQSAQPVHPSASPGMATSDVGLTTVQLGTASPDGSNKTAVLNGNTVALPAPGTGFNRIEGFGPNDQLDLTAALAGTTWDHQQATLPQFVGIGHHHHHTMISVGGVPVAEVHGQRPSMRQISSH